MKDEYRPSYPSSRISSNGIVNGAMYAVPFDASVKSLVWYSPKMFAAKGYLVPQTWDQMVALSDKIAADPSGIKPWCAGVASGAATGWTATDWLEEVVLRQAGPDVYDQWIAHTVKFSDPQIAAQMKAYDFHKVIDNSYVERLVKDGFFEKTFGASIKAEQDRKRKAAFR